MNKKSDDKLQPSDAEKVGVKRKSLASPKIVSKLSPINTFVNRNIVESGAKANLLKYAENKKSSMGHKSQTSASTNDMDAEEEDKKVN